MDGVSGEFGRWRTYLFGEGVNMRDELSPVVGWLKSGPVDSHHFAQFLPFTSRDLRDNTVSPQTVADTLTNIFVARTSLEERSHHSYVTLRPDVLVNYVLSGMEVNTKLSQEILLHFKELLQQHMPKATVRLNEFNPAPVMSALNAICSHFATVLDGTVFQGNEGQFLRSCPLFNLPENMFLTVSKSIGFLEFHPVKESLLAALKEATCGIVSGTDLVDIVIICWECRNREPRSLVRCPTCNVAQYCSKSCQMQAWNSGHSDSCDDLAKRYCRYQSFLATTKSMHDFSRTKMGFSLSPRADFRVLFDVAIGPPFGSNGDESDDKIYPSMDAYYDALMHIARGSWWCFPSPGGNNEEEQLFNYNHSRRQRHVQLETDFFFDICLALAESHRFDCLEYGIPLSTLPEGSIPSLSKLTKAQQEMGTPMPAGRFLQLYRAEAWSHVPREQLANQTDGAILQWLCYHCHK